MLEDKVPFCTKGKTRYGNIWVEFRKLGVTLLSELVELQHLLHGEGQLGAAPGAAGLARRSEDYKMKNVKTVKMIKYYHVTHIG